MRGAYDLPGGAMLSVSLPGNGLTAGIVGDPSPEVHGTDPAGSARDALAMYVPQDASTPQGVPSPGLTETLAKVGRGVAFSVVALILVAIGVWVVVKQ